MPGCFYGRGSTTDKVLFYDVRDPQSLRYVGAMTAAELGVREISSVTLARAPVGAYLLSAGGNGTYTSWLAARLSPDIGDWRRIAGQVPTGQHGMTFSSHEKTSHGAAPKRRRTADAFRLRTSQHARVQGIRH